ncbi:MAG: hypothetical protein HFE93_04090 [Acutalibacter muris]|nr:hypothetical protein [Acutalibacter muris]
MGHKGPLRLSAYPTKVGGHIEIDSGVDILKTWREITGKYGMGLFAHHSGTFEINAVEHHPEWSALDEKGRSYSVSDTNPPRRYARKA